jgi:hypothetical protein
MDATKNVAWAMDQDWQERVQKYEAAAKEAEIAGELLRFLRNYEITDIVRSDRDWEAARVSYEGELADMRSLRQSLSRILVNLRVETEKLQREDEAMRDQEFKFRQSYKQLEQTQQRYRAKGKKICSFACAWSECPGYCSTVGSGRNQECSVALQQQTRGAVWTNVVCTRNVVYIYPPFYLLSSSFRI